MILLNPFCDETKKTLIRFEKIMNGQVNMQFLGMIAALTSSASWAIAMIIYYRLLNRFPPLRLNLFRGIIVCFYLTLPLCVIGWTPASFKDIALLLISGILGIAVADTFYFLALNHLGPRLTAVTVSLVPVATSLASFFFLNEKLHNSTWLGIALTSLGVGWVLWERNNKPVALKINKPLGLLHAALSITFMTLSILLAKIGISSTQVTQGAFLRMGGAVIALILLNAFRRKECFACWKQLADPRLLKMLLWMAFITTFGGFFLSLYALKYLPTAVASTLSSAAPLFILPMTMWFLKEKISFRAVLGAVIILIGIAFIVW